MDHGQLKNLEPLLKLTPIKINHQIIAVVDNVLRLKKDTLGSQMLNEICLHLTRDNPDFFQMQNMQRMNPKKFGYIKLPDRYIKSYQEDDDTLYIPRGCLDLLKQISKKYGHSIKFFDQRISYPPLSGMQMSDKIDHLKYQNDTINAAISNGEGIIEAPCGSGKTVIAMSIICHFKQPSLIVCDKQKLLDQWRGEFADKAFLPCSIGQYGGGVKKPTDLTIATVQTLYRMDGNDPRRLKLREFLSRFGLIYLDECHHTPASTFLEIMNLSPSKYRFGTTATPKRKDGKHFLMYDVIGPIIHTVDDYDLEKENRIQTCTVNLVHTEFYTSYTSNEWVKLLNDLVNDGDRNNLILDSVVNSFHHNKTLPLVLSDRVAHCRFLCESLRRRGLDARLLLGSGSMDPREAKRNIADANAQKVDVIIGTSVADEGLDIPSMSDCHLTIPTDNEAKLKQRIGRVRRVKDGKSFIHDYVDYKCPSMNRKAKMRLNLYHRWGFEIL